MVTWYHVYVQQRPGEPGQIIVRTRSQFWARVLSYVWEKAARQCQTTQQAESWVEFYEVT